MDSRRKTKNVRIFEQIHLKLPKNKQPTKITIQLFSSSQFSKCYTQNMPKKQNNINLTIQEILNLKTYQPTDYVTNLMQKFTSELQNTTSIQELSITETEIQQLKTICAITETELEKHWATQIIQSSRPAETIKQYPYYQDYVNLIQKEIKLLLSTQWVIPKNGQALIIGSGPLPLTSYELFRQVKLQTIDHVDISEEACQLCEHFHNALQIPSIVHYSPGETATLPLQKYDFIVVASLAGTTVVDKQNIIKNIIPSLKPNGRILVRSAQGIRSLMYLEVPGNCFDGLSLINEHHPDDKVVNSGLVYQTVR